MPEPTHQVTPGPDGPGAAPPVDPSAEIEAIEEEVVDSVFAHSRLISHLVLLAVLAVGTLLAFREMAGYPENATEFPRLTLFAGLGMIAVRAVQLVIVARRDGQPTRDRSRLVKELIMMGWLLLLGVLLILLGIIPGAIVFLAAYLAVNRPVNAWRSVLVVVLTAVAVHLLFVEVLNLPFQPGTLFR